jgi:hypothetical protein
MPVPIFDDATPEVRMGIILSAKLHLLPTSIRKVVCRRLRKEPDPGNWSEEPNVWDEDVMLIRQAPWYKAYDIAEDLYAAVLSMHGPTVAETFQADLVELLAAEGIGWTMNGGLIVRADLELLGEAVHRASAVLEVARQESAKQAMEGALRDLSIRPKADTVGAVHKSVGAVESIVRSVTGDPKHTLGELLKSHKEMFPPPLEVAIEKIWGFASEHARHIREGGAANLEEAELVVGVCAAVCIYLGKKGKLPDTRI